MLNKEDISKETDSCITFGGRVKTFKTTTVRIDCSFLKGTFQSLVLPFPIVDVILGKLLSVLDPIEDVNMWNKYGFKYEPGNVANAVTRQSVRQGRENSQDEENSSSQSLEITKVTTRMQWCHNKTTCKKDREISQGREHSSSQSLQITEGTTLCAPTNNKFVEEQDKDISLTSYFEKSR